MPEHDPERSSEADKALSIAPMRLIGVRFYKSSANAVDISIQNQWGSRTPRTQIVAIGAHGTMFWR
jgi:hypothetical protein